MASTVVSTNVHTALIPWTDIDAGIKANYEKLIATRPAISVAGGNAMMNQVSGSILNSLGMTWNMSPQTLDKLLRATVPELPSLGLYSVTNTSNDQVNGLSVTWKDEE